jgi:hypothetical protein
MNNADVRDIHRCIASLARDLHNRPGSDAEAVISELTDHAASEVPGAEYAGVTVATRPRHVATAAATHRYPVMLDEIQRQHLEGPSLTAVWDHHSIRIDDLATDTRWPAYQHDAIARTPIRSILSFELCTSRKSMGALSVYSSEPHAFSDEAEEIGVVYATHAALVWDSVLRADQFHRSLTSRDTIGQAKGIIMERFRVDAVRAFELLKKQSQQSNTPLAEFARNLVAIDERAGGHQPRTLPCASAMAGPSEVNEVATNELEQVARDVRGFAMEVRALGYSSVAGGHENRFLELAERMIRHADDVGRRSH